jgi:hypothetical protein
LTKQGALLGTADTGIADTDYPNTNPFMVGFPDPYLVHAFAWQRGQLHDLGALAGNNSSAVFEANGRGAGVGMSETAITDLHRVARRPRDRVQRRPGDRPRHPSGRLREPSQRHQ